MAKSEKPVIPTHARVRDLRVGDLVPAYIPGVLQTNRGKYWIPQTIEDIEELDNGLIRVTTDGGIIDDGKKVTENPLLSNLPPVWDLHPNDEFQMPMSPNGGRPWKDWRKEAEKPRVGNLRHGDIIMHIAKEEGLRVMRLQKSAGWNELEIVVVCYSEPEDKFFRYVFPALSSIVRWPYKPDPTTQRPEISPEELYRRENFPNGPYVNKKTGEEYFFYTHPHGRGRWPGHIPEFGAPGARKTRPPKQAAMWKLFKYQGKPNMEHPQDPDVVSAEWRDRKRAAWERNQLRPE